ncbi:MULTISPECIES: hypothetical protein [unclassified Paenibacillus]|uniref:hypothetical protein n=1 Tax=unclassified Paenibacillus TaxID=185978 RepID=UPI002406805E|nr:MULTISPECIES: hypothetical protein [unclassified Paenibacillus]MDH6507670.1 hypothetical protein [Paenibacillus sp. PastM-3]
MKIKKTGTLIMMVLFSMFMLPMLAYADDNNPITKIKEKMKFNWKVLDGLDFVFTPIGLVISLLTIATLVFVVVRVIIKLVKISTGKGTIKDKWFWIEAGLIVFIVFLFISGAFFSFLENIYNWTSTQDLGGEKSALWTQPDLRKLRG